jgi:hypothetical protein
MEFAIRMRTIMRILVFVALAVIWLVLMTLLNNAYLNVSDLSVILSSLVLAAGTTIGIVHLLRM